MKSPQLLKITILRKSLHFCFDWDAYDLEFEIALATFPVFGHLAIQNFVHGFADSLCIVCRYPESQITSVELHLMHWASLSPEL